MFVFDYSEDKDVYTYEYRLYTKNQVEADLSNPGYYQLISGASIDSGTVVPYSQGFNAANVFTVAVENSTASTISATPTSPIPYYGAIRAIDTSGNKSPWTLIIKTDTDTPLIDEQFIGSLTAAKITAGEIGAHEIILSQGSSPNWSMIKSATYDDDYAHGAASPTQGWYIRGDGHFNLGGPRGITYDNSTITIGSGVQVNANFASDSISVGGATKLNINNGIGFGVGGMTVGDPTYNYWYANGLFSVGSATNSVVWNGVSLNITGNITGSTINAADINGSTITVGTFDGNPASAGLRISEDGFIQEGGGGVQIKNYDGTGNTYFDGNLIFTTDVISTGDIFAVNIVSTGNISTDSLFATNDITASTLTIDDITATNDITAANDIYASHNLDVGNNISVTGRIYIYSTNPIIASTMASSASVAGVVRRSSDGAFCLNSSSSVSQRKYKTNIRDLDSAIATLLNLKPRNFTWTDELVDKNYEEDIFDLQTQTQYGFIVEEVAEVNSNLVHHELIDGNFIPKMWKSNAIIALCVKTIQELSERIDILESRLI